MWLNSDAVNGVEPEELDRHKALHSSINELIHVYETDPDNMPPPIYMPVHAVPAQHPTGNSPTEPVALQVAMECLNSDEIADRLPKDIPGLAESDQEELIVSHRSYGQLPTGSPMDSSGVLPRHLLGELASELEA